MKGPKLIRISNETIGRAPWLLLALCFLACQCSYSEAPWPAGKPIIHPTLHVSDPAQLNTDQLDCAAFRRLNDRYLNEDNRDYYRAEIVKIEEKALLSDRLNELLKGRSPSEVTERIGLPRITAGRISDETIIDGDRNWLYYFGYLPFAVRVAFQDNRCIRAYPCQFKETRAIEKIALLELKKHAVGKSADDIEKYLHHKLYANFIPAPQLYPIPVVNGGPAEKRFDVGSDFVWDFHFVDGKCTEITDSIVLN